MLVTATLAAITVNSTSVTIFTQKKYFCRRWPSSPADQGPRLPSIYVALPSPRDSKSFVPGRWKQRERLCSEMAHITISYIHLGRMSPQAALGCQGSWAGDALAGQTSLSDRTTMGWGGGTENELVVDTWWCWPQQPGLRKAHSSKSKPLTNDVIVPQFK